MVEDLKALIIEGSFRVFKLKFSRFKRQLPLYDLRAIFFNMELRWYRDALRPYIWTKGLIFFRGGI